ncbi:MAG: cysteine desulfurase NifS [Ruminococcaceae bacterium]|nr:cysteine desulfurase NifS [Oscillospiraceae bacterium]
MEKEKRIYADNAATTPVLPEVVEAMLPCFTELWGNPSSLHADGQAAAEKLIAARATIANVIGAAPSEIYFTSCGSESDNWAIKGAAAMAKNGRNKIITSKIEHPAVMNTCKSLEKDGFTVAYIGVDEKGILDMNELSSELDETTAIVAIMLANNEIGTIQPIKEIAKLAKEAGALMFTDAVQAVGSIKVDVKELGVDMLAFSGHKLGAPKGIGALYIKKGTRVKNLINGGAQENGKRAGTENLPYIVGLAKALEIADQKLPDMERVRAMRNRLIDGLTKIPYSKLNGDRDMRLPGNANVSFAFIEGESMLLWLDIMGISASTGSACSSKSLEPSHVLLATGLPIEMAHGSLRFSLSHMNTEDEVDRIIEVVTEVVAKLRAMSPLSAEAQNEAVYVK